MKRPLTVALVAAFIPLLVVLVFYFAKFWSPHLANEQADWGVFGDYVGGTLGALYALAAFLAVLYASYVQSNEAAIALNEQRAQATIEQLQRVVASTAENIDRILRAAPLQPLSGPHQRAQLQGAAFNVDWVLTAAAARRLTGDEINPAEAVRKSFRDEEIRSINYELFLLKAEVLHFAHCLTRFRDAGGSDAVQAVYHTRYEALVIQLDDLGFLTDFAAEYFNIEKLRRTSAEVRAESRQHS